jgi:RHS repeat-associated protein
VSFTYDVPYNRVKTMTDGTGTTTYTYYPLTDPPTLTNPLGSFTYTYEGVTGRPASLTYPNRQQTSWSYADNLGDRRLLEIHNKRPGGATLSRFEYTYDKAGNILTWVQQADSDPPKMYDFGYDATDQLTAAILKSTDPVPQILKRYYYAYDSAGNRTTEQIDDAVTGATYNNMNQLVSQQAGGALVFKGTVSEPASMTVGGKPATVTADNRFEGQAVVPGGTGQVAVTATDPSGNTRTSTYQVSQGATSKAFTYDANGNMTSDGTRTYEWDAESRLVAVKESGATVAGYTYNAGGLRASMTTGGVTTSYVLQGTRVVEERRSPGGVTRHFQGPAIDHVLATQDAAGVVTYLTRDHLGSIREHLTSGGVLTLRQDYDPWGTSVSANTGGWGYTGRENEPETSLLYYRARYYRTTLGRFVSEDPVGLRGGTNRYAYAGGSPAVRIDPLGWVWTTPEGADVCAASVFFRDMGRGTASAGVCCRAKSLVPCLNEDVVRFASAEARKCMVAHEESHIRDMGDCKCNSPRCVLQTPTLDEKSECSAMAVSLQCFMGSRERNPAGEYWEDWAFVWLYVFCFGVNLKAS